MKKVTNLAVIILAIIFMSCGCDPDPIVPEPDELTASDLSGMWTFQSLDYLGSPYVLNSTALADLNEDHDYIQFDLDFISETEVNLLMDYIGSLAQDNLETDADWDYEETYDEYLPFQLVGDVIKIPELNLELKILNFDSFDGTPLTMLELEMLNCINSTAPINGVFTLN